MMCEVQPGCQSGMTCRAHHDHACMGVAVFSSIVTCQIPQLLQQRHKLWMESGAMAWYAWALHSCNRPDTQLRCILARQGASVPHTRLETRVHDVSLLQLAVICGLVQRQRISTPGTFDRMLVLYQ